MGFDISKCGGKTDCESIVKRIEGACDATTFMNDADTAICMDDYVGKFHSYAADDPVYSHATPPITKEDHDKLTAWQKADAEAAPAVTPQEEAGLPAPAGAQPPAEESAAPAAAAGAAALEDEFEPYNSKWFHLSLQYEYIFTQKDVFSWGANYNEAEGEGARAKYGMQPHAFSVDAMLAMNHLFSHAALNKKIAMGNEVTPEEAYTRFNIGPKIHYRWMKTAAVKASDGGSDPGAALHELGFGVAGDFAVTNHIRIGLSLFLARVFAPDGMAQGENGMQEVPFVGDKGITAAGGEVNLFIDANSSSQADIAFKISMGGKHLWSNGITSFRGDANDVSANIFWAGFGLEFSTGNVNTYEKAGDPKEPAQSIGDYNVYWNKGNAMSPKATEEQRQNAEAGKKPEVKSDETEEPEKSEAEVEETTEPKEEEKPEATVDEGDAVGDEFSF